MGAAVSRPAPATVPVELSAGARLPERASEGANGYDLCAHGLPEGGLTLGVGERALVGTGVKIALGGAALNKRVPADFAVYAAVRGRSGLARRGVSVFEGTVDSDYRGEIGVILTNNSTEPFKVDNGDRVAQLVFAVCALPTLQLCAAVNELHPSARGERGFGSTGVQEVVVAKPLTEPQEEEEQAKGGESV